MLLKKKSAEKKSKTFFKKNVTSSSFTSLALELWSTVIRLMVSIIKSYIYNNFQSINYHPPFLIFIDKILNLVWATLCLTVKYSHIMFLSILSLIYFHRRAHENCPLIVIACNIYYTIYIYIYITYNVLYRYLYMCIP